MSLVPRHVHSDCRVHGTAIDDVATASAMALDGMEVKDADGRDSLQTKAAVGSTRPDRIPQKRSDKRPAWALRAEPPCG